jgi:adenylate kinase
LLDGYPRTPEQVGELDAILHSDGHNLDTVIELTVEIDAVVARLVKRAQEQGRADDTEDVIRRRLELYAEQTAPLLAIYRSRGILIQVDGLGDITDVTGRIFAVLGVEF